MSLMDKLAELLLDLPHNCLLETSLNVYDTQKASLNCRAIQGVRVTLALLPCLGQTQDTATITLITRLSIGLGILLWRLSMDTSRCLDLEVAIRMPQRLEDSQLGHIRLNHAWP